MTNKFIWVLLCMFMAVSSIAFSTDTKKFFQSQLSPEKGLDAGKLFPEGKIFPLRVCLAGRGLSTQTEASPIYVMVNEAVNKNFTPMYLEQLQTKGNDKNVTDLIRHDLYSRLVNGAREITFRVNDFKVNAIYLKAVEKICKELNGVNKLGQIFLFGELRRDISISILNGPQKVSFKHGKSKQICSSVSLANLAYENKRYVFLVNHSDKKVEAVVGGLVYGSDITVQDLFVPKRIFPVPEGEFTIELEPFEVKALKIYNTN